MLFHTDLPLIDELRKLTEKYGMSTMYRVETEYGSLTPEDYDYLKRTAELYERAQHPDG